MDNLTEEKMILADPFEGDYGEDEYVLSDKMVTARKQHECFNCESTIYAGERHRSRSGVHPDDGLNQFRWCNACCVAMAADWDDPREDRFYSRSVACQMEEEEFNRC